MAKKKYKIRRSGSRRSYFKMKSKRRKSSSTSAKLIQIDAMAYGGLRGITSDFIQSKLPANLIGQFAGLADEAAMLGVSYLLAKKTGGFFKQVGLKGLTIENARVGEAVLQMILSKTTSNSASSGFVYG